MGVDLERDGGVGVADPVTKDLGLDAGVESVEYVCRTSWSRIRREPAASTRPLNLLVTVSGWGRCPFSQTNSQPSAG